MKFRTNIIFFVLGLTAFAILISRFGLDRIFDNIARAGWSLLYVLIIWLLIYMLNAAAWRLALGRQAQKIPFFRLFMVTVSGFVINYVTPVLALGGEPYKMKALSASMGEGGAVSAVVLYRMVHLLGHMLLLLTGIAAALLLLNLPPVVDATLCVVGLAILAVIVVTLSGHREGIFQRLHRAVSRIPLLRRFSALLDRLHDLQEMDDAITHVYHNERMRLYLSILLEYVSRILMGIEVYLILRGVGIETTLMSALFVYVSYSIVINLLFFIPLNLGSREGGLALGLQTLALPPLLGVYLGVVMRIREFFWILLGLLFILLSGEKGISSAKHP